MVDSPGTDVYTTNVLNEYTQVADANYTYDEAGNMTNDGQYEYGAPGLLRKFLYGPAVDRSVRLRSGQANRMIEVADANAAHYYHFDGLGSVVALSDADGDTVQTYEYSIYGEPAASDPNHPNPFLFTARRFDKETGLYHYRARAYNPYIGRFLQTDPAKQGMNWYTYCANRPLSLTDPSGLVILIVPRVIIPPRPPDSYEPVVPGGEAGSSSLIYPYAIPTARQLLTHAFRGNGGTLVYYNSGGCWSWAMANEGFSETLHSHVFPFLTYMWRDANKYYDVETNTINLPDSYSFEWDGKNYGLEGLFATPSEGNRKVAFTWPLSIERYFTAYYWINRMVVFMDYSISIDAEGITMNATFLINDDANLHPERYGLEDTLYLLIAGGLDLLTQGELHYTEYPLYIRLGTHQVRWNTYDPDDPDKPRFLLDGAPW